MTQRMTATIVVALVLSAACGGSAPEPEGAAGAPAPAAAAAESSAGPRNACTLVDQAALEAIAGQKLEMLNSIESDTETVCELSAAADHTPLIYVTVHWSGGQEEARINDVAMGMTRKLLNEPDLDIDKLTGSETVPGLADQAYYSDIMPAWVLKDDVFIEVISPRFGGDETKAVFLAVARTALSRL